MGVRCGAAAVGVGVGFGAAGPETESRREGGRKSSRRRQRCVAARAVLGAVVRGHGLTVPYPDLGPAPCLWDPQAPLALGRTPGLPGHFHNPPPHLHQLLNLGSQIRSDTPSTQASPFQTLTPGSTTHGHPLPLKPFPVGGSLSLVSFIFSDLAFLTLRTSVSLGAILMGCLSVRGLV